MNMKRGLWRLWLVASALWVAIVGLALIPKIADEFSALRAEEELALSRKVFKPLDVDKDTLRKLTQTAYRKPLQAGLIEIMEQVAAPLQHPAVDREAVRKLLSETNIPPPPKPGASLADRFFYREQIGYWTRSPVYLSNPANPSRIFAATLMAGIIPLLIVLLLGSSFYWAVAGFRKS